MYHIVTSYAVAELAVGMNDIGVGGAEVAAPTQMVEQGTLHRQVTDGIAPRIEVEEPI